MSETFLPNWKESQNLLGYSKNSRLLKENVKQA